VTQPYLSFRCPLLRAQAVSAAPAASFKPPLRTSALLSVVIGRTCDLATSKAIVSIWIVERNDKAPLTVGRHLWSAEAPISFCPPFIKL
jgi:hypothetical protein